MTVDNICKFEAYAASIDIFEKQAENRKRNTDRFSGKFMF